MPSLVASKLIAGARGLAQALLRRAATVALDWDTRQKSRFEAIDSTGRAIGVFLARGTIVRGGDVLVAEDGSLVVVEALAQPVLVASAAKTSQTPALDLARAAYHLGNRHVALEVRADRLVLEPDHVLAELLRRMGLHVAETRGAFEPEAGAYDAASTHGHGGHDHDQSHGHDRAHDHDHEDQRGHGHDHAHELHDHGHHPRKP
ncbi:MAG TPA: urease accessory protein UreE [Caldimonas sp.]|nr:urease accessory protein UreE [Caldimonas sp.]